jgi:hypothetical protein
MDSTSFSPSSQSNSAIDGNQITFGTVNFRPHPPTLTSLFASLDQEMGLTIGSFNFRHVYSGPLASKTAVAATSETSVDSSSEENSPGSIKPAKSKKNVVDELGKIMENLDFKESSNQPDIGLEENSDIISNYSEEDFAARYGDVSYSSEDEWVSGLQIYDDKSTIFS